MASETDTATVDLYFRDGMAKVVTHYREEDDIMYVRHRDGGEVPVWSDRRIAVNSRYETHSLWLEWREKQYEGDPRPPQVKEYWDYHPSVEEAMQSALQAQDQYFHDYGEQVPIMLNER